MSLSRSDGNEAYEESVRIVSAWVTTLSLQASEADKNASLLKKLAPELLASVFQWLGVRDILSASEVSKSWHDVIFSSPAIWDHINYSTHEYAFPEALHAMLKLSAQRPLYLQVGICFKDLRLDDVCAAIKPHIHRCVALSIQLHENHCDTTDWSDEAPDPSIRPGMGRLAATLCQPALRLRKFRFLNYTRTDLEVAGHMSLFAGVAPHLELVKVLCSILTLQWSHEAFRQVKIIKYCALDQMQYSHIVKLVELFPSAEELSLELAQPEYVPSFNGQPRLNLPRNLRLFVIGSEDINVQVHTFLQYFRHSVIPAIWISYSEKATTPADGLALVTMCQMDSTEQFHVRMASIESSNTIGDPLFIRMFEHEISTDDVMNRAPGEVTRERSGIDIHNAITIDPMMFVSVTRLIITELVFDLHRLGNPLPPLPNLRHLEITTLRTISHSKLGFCSGFIAPLRAHAAEVLRCPVLETLCIMARRSNDEVPPTRVSPDMVSDFVETFLRYDTSVLKLLAFRGVEIVVVDPIELQRMLMLAENTEWDNVPISPDYPNPETLAWDW